MFECIFAPCHNLTSTTYLFNTFSFLYSKLSNSCQIICSPVLRKSFQQSTSNTDLFLKRIIIIIIISF